jgi:exopolysaccharide/PEP-CTERM locus tyrosine autokinase
MSFIERAVEQLQQEKASVPAGEPRQRAVAPPTEPRIEPTKPVPDRPGETVRAVPCRTDRRVTLDRSALRGPGLIAPENEERRLGEEYRLIKRPLLKAMSGEGAAPQSNVIVVTSAVPGEGKTFTSVNLALSLALERNREVVLVDGDVAKRDITRLLKLDDEPGLLDAGGAEARDFEDTILRTDIPSLYVLPAGNQHVEATEILASERMTALIASLAADPRRIVLIDSPPLLVTSEAGVLASLAGQVVVVVKASETPQEIVLRAVEALPEDKAVSLVLNQVLSVPERSYGHYGYYGEYGSYGYGHKSDRMPEPADDDSA